MMTCSPPTIGWMAHTSSSTAFLSRGGADRAGEPSHSAVNRSTGFPVINLPVFIYRSLHVSFLVLNRRCLSTGIHALRAKRRRGICVVDFLAIPMGSLIWSRFL